MRRLVVLVVLLWPGARAGAQDPPTTAEDVVKRCREKLAAAKTIRIVGDVTTATAGSGHFELWIKGSNRFRLHLTEESAGRKKDATVVADGRRVLAEGLDLPGSPFGPSPADFPARLRSSAIGPLVLREVLRVHEGRTLSEEKISLKGREKLGRGNAFAMAFSYSAPSLGSVDGSTWIDATTFLPVKHSLAFEKMGECAEEYSTFELDVEIPDATFAIATRAGLTRALARQVAKSVALYQLYTGSRPRSLDALTAKSDVGTFWPDGGFCLRSIPRDAWGRPFMYEEGRLTSLGTDGKPGGAGEDQDIVVELAVAPGQPIRPPTDRLRAYYTARIHLQLLAAAVLAYQETYRELPPSLSRLSTRVDGEEVWPEGGFVSSIPPDASGGTYVYELRGNIARVRCAALQRLRLEKLTEDERQKLAAAARVPVTDAEKSQIAELIGRLRDDDPEVRDAAAKSLERLGARAAATLDERIQVETDADLVARLRDVRSRIVLPPPPWQTELGGLTVRVRGPVQKRPHIDSGCVNNLSQLWKMQHIYLSRFGHSKLFCSKTGADFWLELSRTTPALIDESQRDLYVCPGLGSDDACTYWGPAEDVNTYGDGDPVGMCDDPSHGEEIVILRKSGDTSLYKRGDPLHEAALKKLKASPDE